MQSDPFQMKEIELAKRFVESHHVRKDMVRKCPVCGHDENRYFFTKWRVDYLCCSKCDSIFAVCDEQTVIDYLHNEELLELRLSKEYQDQITESRNRVWKEFLEWVEVRSFRFIGRNKSLNILDIGNRMNGLVEMTRDSEMCKKYELRDSICHVNTDKIMRGEADLIFYNDVLKTEYSPAERLELVRDYLKDDGIIYVGIRAGSGFDIITLKENNTKIYPYEHILLPSVKGITILLEKCGYKVLEITAPGVMDVKYVMDDIDKLDEKEVFVRQLLTGHDETTLQEFQRFLQKSCMSSYIRVIAKKQEEHDQTV